MKIPILRLNKRILIVPIHADITDEGVINFQNDLTKQVSELEAQGVIIDISALDIIDSFMARVLNDTTSMIRLLGAEVVICGIQPAIALTLVEMGRNLVNVSTAFNLEKALIVLAELIEKAHHLSLGKKTNDRGIL